MVVLGGFISYMINQRIRRLSIFWVGKEGILKVSNKDAIYGTSNDKYFYVDEEGNKRALLLSPGYFGITNIPAIFIFAGPLYGLRYFIKIAV